MPDWIAHGLADATNRRLLVDGVLLVFLIELLWISTRRPAPRLDLVPTLMAGLSLTLALRFALVDGSLIWMLACLAAAGVFHGWDLWFVRRVFETSHTTALPGQERTPP
jgi:hypothetical protein